LNILKKRL